MRRILRNLSIKARVCTVIAVSLLIGAGPFYVFRASGANIQQRFIQLRSSYASAQTDYKIGFTIATPGAYGSVVVDFCSNSAIYDDVCVAPTGFDISGASLAAQTGQTGFSVDTANTTANTLLLKRNPAQVNSGVGDATYTMSGVRNPSPQGAFFARIKTYASFDGTGSMIDRGGIAMVINKGISVSAEVPPYLYFCVGITIDDTDCDSADGNYVNIGVMGPDKAASGQSQMVAATNAQNGYTIRAVGLPLASGSNVINPLAQATPSAPGLNQFGINLRHNTNPVMGEEPFGPGAGMPETDYNRPNLFTYRSGDVVAGKTTSENYRKYTVTYVANVPRGQAPGVYSGTYTYIALGNF